MRAAGAAEISPRWPKRSTCVRSLSERPDEPLPRKSGVSPAIGLILDRARARAINRLVIACAI